MQAHKSAKSHNYGSPNQKNQRIWYFYKCSFFTNLVWQS